MEQQVVFALDIWQAIAVVVVAGIYSLVVFFIGRLTSSK